MELDLEGKRALVTGGSSGIGLEIARALVGEGAEVAINARAAKRLRLSVKETGASIAVEGDMSDPDTAQDVVDRACSHLGGLDILVCTIGDGTPLSAGFETKAHFEASLAANLWPAINATNASIDQLSKGGGVIVCVSSICGIERIPGAPVSYMVAKSALVAYVGAIAAPLAPKDVRIVGIAPGNVLTEGGRWQARLAADRDATMTSIGEQVPLKRFASAEEVAHLVMIAASDRLAFATGTTWVLDGGQTRSAH